MTNIILLHINHYISFVFKKVAFIFISLKQIEDVGSTYALVFHLQNVLLFVCSCDRFFLTYEKKQSIF